MMHIMKEVSYQIWNIDGARDETDTTLVLFCVQALFHVTGYVNFEDKSQPPAVYHMLTHTVPTHHYKGRFCATTNIHFQLSGQLLFV
jgi:hypothetical protein